MTHALGYLYRSAAVSSTAALILAGPTVASLGTIRLVLAASILLAQIVAAVSLTQRTTDHLPICLPLRVAFGRNCTRKSFLDF